MRDVILRPDAATDIEDAADYTLREWGDEQARTYIGDLRRSIEALAKTALRNPLHEEVLPGLRRKRSGMHHIYYFADDESVDILKIIHVQRDPAVVLKVGRPNREN